MITTCNSRSVYSDGLQSLFMLLDEAPLPADFLSERSNPVEVPRNPREDWSA